MHRMFSIPEDKAFAFALFAQTRSTKKRPTLLRELAAYLFHAFSLMKRKVLFMTDEVFLFDPVFPKLKRNKASKNLAY